ncbi:homeobox-domain-containing protein [Dentipellis sp. KUC8613]|nr:homeobox-domain-containing protein [Dentipellis sp. KUC8613]
MEQSFSSWPQPSEAPSKQPDEPKDKPKKPRHRHTAVQLAALNELYDKNEHPSLDERTALAERLGMETKTVNAWFQNKRASAKKRHRGAPPAALELPPISSLLASTSSISAPAAPSEFDDSEFHTTLPPPRLDNRMPGKTALDHKTHLSEPYAVDHKPGLHNLPLIDPPPPQQLSAFYAGNPDHRHTYESNNREMLPRPRMRMRPTPQQTEQLRKYYQKNQHPSKDEREELARQIGMRGQSVTNWFQNQRSLARKRQDEDAETASMVSMHDKPKSEEYSNESRRYSPYPPASDHPSLRLRSSHPSISTLTNGATRSPSVPPSVVSATSRASPYHSVPPSQRPRRTRPEPHQLEALQKLYNRTSSPSIDERTALALEVGMDVAKVTNWFRNLRQTARKRAKKPGDDGDTDSLQLGSASASRAATPSYGSWSSGSLDDHGMDTEVDEADPEPMDEDNYENVRRSGHSDAGSDEEYQEAVTPSPEPSPSPPPPSLNSASFTAVSRSHRPRMGMDVVEPVSYPDIEKVPERMSGVKVEDALLLLGFHHHIVR